jgi:DNA-binding NarL/FixJ family response regulator
MRVESIRSMSADAPIRNDVRGRFIIVEDSYLVAAGLEYLLSSSDCEVVGKAGSVGAALTLVDTVPFDVAILDIDLHGENVAPVADAIRQSGREVIFLSGYGEADMLPSHLQSLPRLEKPVDPTELFDAIDRALGDQVA